MVKRKKNNTNVTLLKDTEMSAGEKRNPKGLYKVLT